MGLRDMLKKKEHTDDATIAPHEAEFTIIRTDTTSQDVIYPPDDGAKASRLTAKPSLRSPRRSLDVFRSSRSRSGSASSQASYLSKRRLSDRFHLSRTPGPSEYVPEDLPEITAPADPDDDSQWERRATLLAGQNLVHGVGSSNSINNSSVVGTAPGFVESMSSMSLRERSTSPRPGSVSSTAIDEDIQQAIRLHENGRLDESTKIFARLADPKGANNPLSQVLYGLALRHGWGCAPDPARAVEYLTAAASNSAAVEQMALQAGMTKGGAAKGELVLAIFELANCFRNGWGIKQDAVAAKQYYETAANLGDTDAMNEAAWCYLEGFGCKKDRFTAAQYYRRAEKANHKTLGNSWIWKDKYNPPK